MQGGVLFCVGAIRLTRHFKPFVSTASSSMAGPDERHAQVVADFDRLSALAGWTWTSYALLDRCAR